MRIIRHTVTHCGSTSGSSGDAVPISLPGCAIAIDITSDRSETAPRGGPILAERKWQDDSLLRFADRIGSRY